MKASFKTRMEKNLPINQRLHIETGAGTGGQHGAFEGGREGHELFHLHL
jgi:hypothetical protein